MAKHMLSCLLLLLLLNACASGTQGNAECMNALYRGGLATLNLFDEINRVGRERNVEIREHSGHSYGMTCGKVELVLSTAVSEFNEEGCSWGMDNRVFESNVLSLIEPLTMGCPCPMFEGIREYLRTNGNSWCSPQDEVIEAVSHVVRCGADVFAENRQSFEDFGRVGFSPRACEIVKLFTHCFDGIVDMCHNDNGEASEAILDALTALGSAYLHRVGEYEPFFRGVIQELQACSSELGVFSRVASINLEPASLPEISSEEIFGTFFTTKIKENRWAMKYMEDKIEKVIEHAVAHRLGQERPR